MEGQDTNESQGSWQHGIKSGLLGLTVKALQALPLLPQPLQVLRCFPNMLYTSHPHPMPLLLLFHQPGVTFYFYFLPSACEGVTPMPHSLGSFHYPSAIFSSPPLPPTLDMSYLWFFTLPRVSFPISWPVAISSACECLRCKVPV